ncbi:2-methylfumaryl-CoA isomerase [Lipingzhangella halophila]|uniref:2-methylfumaryl-CoA isomerase n=1 Tax=Lipingzhangella halophila TaxID=1783352 RepID=A0A7W7RF35_9ACTN|nr:CoA transferase [Lipingzhangella halophila]MBB4930488.1 2-methylfumaryl-CoA isomerase [Lipingzhangella halophila]
MAAPLAGVRVIELSSFVASPLGGMTLAQLGADVIRVDHVGGGPDRARWPLAPSGESLYWAELNKGKRSVTADLRSEEGAALVADLVAASGPQGGIVLSNSLAQPALGYTELCSRRADLIHVQLLGRRDGGTAVDYTVNAALGFPAATGPEGHAAPVNHALPAWDMACGLYLAVGLLAAERRRRLTGRGGQVRIALHDVALATAGNLGYLAEAALHGSPRPRIGNHVYGGFGHDFATRDGRRVMVVVLTNRHWRALLDTTGRSDAVAGVERSVGVDFGTDAARYEHRDLLRALLRPWFAARDAAEVERALGATPVLWSFYRDFAEVVADGELHNNPMMGELDQPGIGRCLSPGSPLTLDGHQPPPAPAPRLGEHTAELLRDWLGLSAEHITDLRDRYVAGEQETTE